MTGPDPRLFTTPAEYLNAWCRCHEDRTTDQNTAILARFAGCSERLMLQILNGVRELQRKHVPGLCAGIGLEGEAATHLERVTRLRRVGSTKEIELLKQIWTSHAEAHGLPWDAASSQLDERIPDVLAVAALGPALAALAGERVKAKTLVKRAVVPVSAAQIHEANPVERAVIAPRLVELPCPETPSAARTWHGWLSWAGAAVPRRSKHRRYVSYIAALDEIASLELREIGRTLRGELIELATLAEAGPASRLVAVLYEEIDLVPAIRAASSDSAMRWQRPAILLPPAIDGDTTLSVMDSGSATVAPSRPSLEPRVKPLGFLDMPSCLMLWRSVQKANRRPHSDAYLARRSGLPRTTVQDIAHGRTAFRAPHVPAFVRLFEVENDAEQQAALWAMAELSEPAQAPQVASKLAITLRSLAANQGVRLPETEAWFVRSRWYAQAIHVMGQLRRFEPSTGWICRAMHGRITWKAAEDALHALNTLGLLREDATGRVFSLDPVHTTQGSLSEWGRYDLIQGVLQLVRSELELLDGQQRVTGFVLALPEAAMPRLLALLDRMRVRMRDVLQDAEARRLAGAPMDRVTLYTWQSFSQFQDLISPRRA